MKSKISTSIFLTSLAFISLFIATAFTFTAHSTPKTDKDIPKLENPMSVEYLKKNLRKKGPKLVLTPESEKNLKQKLQSDPVVKNMFEALKLNAAAVQQLPLLERKKIGRRLLSVSREMLYRMNTLGMVYRMEKNPDILKRINEEVLAVCQFSDWNPSHYLDVAEMSMAVAIAIDWTGRDLPKATRELAKTTLIEKGIKPSFNKKGNTGWVNGSNNWNQVCHGGMIAAAIVIADKDPELAAKTISRALDGMPHALVEYGPDGTYPEGSTYWGYGTAFSVLTSSMLESAFGTDFGLADYPAFKASAVFRSLCNAPSGRYYNFADCGDKRSDNGDITLAWFANKMNNAAFFEKDRFLRPPAEMGKLARHAGAGLVWLSQFETTEKAELPTAWKGEGANPIVIFRDDTGYYFGGKGGRGMVNHGNMDGGSFIFELNGVRWVVDPGNQRYHDLEKTGFQLWGRCQECERWTLLTKNNYGHSTLTVNNQLHLTEGMTSIIDFKKGANPETTFDMSPAFEGILKSAQRKFVKNNSNSLLIEDQIEITDKTQMITWQLMTTAEVEMKKGGAILKQDGKELEMKILSHPDMSISIKSLDPPPLKLDRKIEGLKRIDIDFPAYMFEDGKGKIKVELVGK